MKRILTIAIAAALGTTASTAAAVVLNPRGTGQALIYPYYTVNHQQTLVSVINVTAHGKALKVRFREGYDGRDVANFNVYLGPYDAWVSSIFDTSSDGSGGAAIATVDPSCTVPAFDKTYFPTGPAVLKFSNQNYTQGAYGTPTGNDSGFTGLSRTREGMFEIIEMGEIVDQAINSQKTLEAISPVGGNNHLGNYMQAAPPNCAQVVSAWSSGGYWTSNPNVDLLAPAGGIYGAAGIVDVAQGTLYAYDAYGVDGFSDIAQHSGPGNAKPNLSTAITDSQSGVTTAFVSIGNRVVTADYPATTRAIDAVSALFMVDTLYNEFNIESAVGAASDWLITFPTKEFYVDPGIVGGTPDSFLPPFQETFESNGDPTPGADTGFSCVAIHMEFKDREGMPPAPGIPCGGFCPPPTGDEICYQTGVLEFQNYLLLASLALGSNLQLANVTPPSPSGHLILEFNVDATQPNPATPALRPSTNGVTFHGLPAIGFFAVNYINANVTPGVLSNYSAAYPHRSTASCTNSTNPQNVCQ